MLILGKVGWGGIGSVSLWPEQENFFVKIVILHIKIALPRYKFEISKFENLGLI